MVGWMGVKERDEGGRWHGDDQGPNGVAKRLKRLGTRGSRLRVGETCLNELSASSSPKINFIGLSENGLFECR